MVGVGLLPGPGGGPCRERGDRSDLCGLPTSPSWSRLLGDLPEPSRVAPRRDPSECDRNRRLSTALRRVAVCRGVPDRVLGSPHHLLREAYPVKGCNAPQLTVKV